MSDAWEDNLIRAKKTRDLFGIMAVITCLASFSAAFYMGWWIAPLDYWMFWASLIMMGATAMNLLLFLVCQVGVFNVEAELRTRRRSEQEIAAIEDQPHKRKDRK